MDSSITKKVIALIAALIVVLVLAFVLAKFLGPGSETTVNKTPVPTGGEPVLTKVATVPAGFPADIPLERESIIDGYTVNFPPEREMVQHTVTYLTDKTRSQKYSEYLEYMEKAGYDFGENGKDPKAMSLYGIKNNDDLVVTISTQREKTLVQITYIDRE